MLVTYLPDCVLQKVMVHVGLKRFAVLGQSNKDMYARTKSARSDLRGAHPAFLALVSAVFVDQCPCEALPGCAVVSDCYAVHSL